MKTDDELREIALTAFHTANATVADAYPAERRALYNAGLRDAAGVCNAVASAYQGVEALSAKHCHDSILALIEEGKS